MAKLETENKFLEDFNNQLVDWTKKQEQELSISQKKVIELSEQNNILRQENSIYEENLCKLTKRTVALSKSISKRITDCENANRKIEGKEKEIYEQVKSLTKNKKFYPPKRKRGKLQV